MIVTQGFPVPKFSQTDIEDFRLYEGKIVEGFRQVAFAFTLIRDRRLYQINGHSTFEDYCRIRWQYSQSTVYRIIEAARLCDSFEVIGTLSPGGEVMPVVPINEAQCRAFSGGGTDEEKKDVWDKVLESKNGDPNKVRSQDILDELRRSTMGLKEAIPVGSVVKIVDPDHLVAFDGHKGTLTSYKGVGTVVNVDVNVSGQQPVRGVSLPAHYLKLISLPEPSVISIPDWGHSPNDEITDAVVVPTDDGLQIAIALIRLALTEGMESARGDMEKFLEGWG